MKVAKLTTKGKRHGKETLCDRREAGVGRPAERRNGGAVPWGMKDRATRRREPGTTERGDIRQGRKLVAWRVANWERGMAN